MADDEFANADLTGRYGELPPYYANPFRPTRDEEHRSITTKLLVLGLFLPFIGFATICIVNLSTRRPGTQRYPKASDRSTPLGSGLPGRKGLRRYVYVTSCEGKGTPCSDTIF
uniref:Uncharacterized protein n=1 Tax=Ixodes ricinus TaxID=34613 RepID=V5HG26_IXORI